MFILETTGTDDAGSRAIKVVSATTGTVVYTFAYVRGGQSLTVTRQGFSEKHSIWEAVDIAHQVAQMMSHAGNGIGATMLENWLDEVSAEMRYTAKEQ